MKILCEKDKLVESIHIVLKAVSSKTTMPILECLVLQVSEGIIKLTTNDMELGIETILHGEIEEEGSVLVNAKMIAEIVRKLPDSKVSIYVDSNFNITIKSNKSVFYINGLDSEEFPSLPIVEKNNFVTMSQFVLKEMIRQTVFSVSNNESNKVATGELFEVREDEFKVTALDGHRVSVRVTKLKKDYPPVRVIVPGKTLIEVGKILNGELEDEVNLFFTDKHVLFEFDNTIVLSRLIEGEFYKIDKMLNSGYETKITINKTEFSNCLERAALLIRENDKKPIVIQISDKTMKLSMNTKMGSMDEEIGIDSEGSDIQVAFNPKFIIDALRAIEDEEVFIYAKDHRSPFIIKNNDLSYIYLILPINLNQA